MHFFGFDQLHGFDKRIALDTDYTQGYDPAYYALAYDWDQPSGGNPLGGSWMAQSYIHSDSWDNYTRHFDWDEKIHQEARSYLSEKGDSTKAFFCCISYHQPHNPFWISEEIRKRFRNHKLAPLRLPSEHNKARKIVVSSTEANLAIDNFGDRF